jgi:glycosyltransferase involved in cell wall biosynthesis
LLRRRVSVISPGVQMARYPSAAGSPGAPRAAIVGHVSPTKRTDFAVEVVRLVLQEHPDFELHVLGRAQFREEDRRFERQLQEEVAADPVLAGSVHFHGYVDDVSAALSTMGLLLHCRDDEPFGMVVTEGMAAGLPTVCPAAAGPAEIVEHGRTGLLYPAGDPAAAASQVLALLDDGALAARIGSAARAEVERQFSSTHQVSEVDQLLAHLTGTR